VGPRHLTVPADRSVLRERRDADELHGRRTSARATKSGRAERRRKAALLAESEEVERVAVVVVVGLLVDDARGRHVLDRESGGVEDGDAVDAGVLVGPGGSRAARTVATTISPISP